MGKMDHCRAFGLFVFDRNRIAGLLVRGVTEAMDHFRSAANQILAHFCLVCGRYSGSCGNTGRNT